MSSNFLAIYDFSLYPYALGDVLTWNVQTSIHCLKNNRSKVDLFICLDKERPTSTFQNKFIDENNYSLYFTELYSAFFTNPLLSSVTIFMDTKELIKNLLERYSSDQLNLSIVKKYINMINSNDENLIKNNFEINIFSHKNINIFFEDNKKIPMLKTDFAKYDIHALYDRLFKNRFVVLLHARFRLLDGWMSDGADLERDADFVEWYDFLKKAEINNPNIVFVLLGRIQEKPLILLNLKNVISLRSLGLGLGHELALFGVADLFMGTSSGFAAMANFSSINYAIFKINEHSIKAYDIKYGENKLPFSHDKQFLIYGDRNSSELYEILLQFYGNANFDKDNNISSQNYIYNKISIKKLNRHFKDISYPKASISRFELDENMKDLEVLYLLQKKIRNIRNLIKSYSFNEAIINYHQIKNVFPDLYRKHRDLHLLSYKILPFIYLNKIRGYILNILKGFKA